jgi:hypothetical protein|tara:strand:+ start:6787 stop:6978 length:192 start_codon:yes stop_codon:yes gene_type:complete
VLTLQALKLQGELEIDNLIQFLIDFAGTLPPLLQLLLGMFVTFGIFKCLITIIDFIEDKREGK